IPSSCHHSTVFIFFFSFICCSSIFFFFFFNDTATSEIYTLSLHDALPISIFRVLRRRLHAALVRGRSPSALRLQAPSPSCRSARSEEHTSELQSRSDLVCRLLLEKKKKK